MPNAYTSLQITDGTKTFNLLDNVNFMVVEGGWSPAVSPLTTEILAGQSPYLPVEENITINIRGASAAEAMKKLRELNIMLDQAQRWSNNEPVSPVLIKASMQGSNPAKVVEATILGRVGQPMVALPQTFNDGIIFYEIQGVTLSFVRTGCWLFSSYSLDNLYLDGEFRYGTHLFNTNSSGTATVNYLSTDPMGTPPPAGLNMVVISNPTGSGTVVREEAVYTALESNTTYTMSYWVRGVSIAANATTVRLYTAANALFSEVPMPLTPSGAMPNGLAWERVTITFTTGPVVTKMRIKFSLTTGGGSDWWLAFTGVLLQKGTQLPQEDWHHSTAEYMVSRAASAANVGSVQALSYIKAFDLPSPTKIVYQYLNETPNWNGFIILSTAADRFKLLEGESLSGTNVSAVADTDASGGSVGRINVTTPQGSVTTNRYDFGSGGTGNMLLAKSAYIFATLKSSSATAVWNIKVKAGRFGATVSETRSFQYAPGTVSPRAVLLGQVFDPFGFASLQITAQSSLAATLDIDRIVLVAADTTDTKVVALGDNSNAIGGTAPILEIDPNPSAYIAPRAGIYDIDPGQQIATFTSLNYTGDIFLATKGATVANLLFVCRNSGWMYRVAGAGTAIKQLTFSAERREAFLTPE